MSDVTGAKNAVVTGGGSGIGAAVVERLRGEGYNVATIDLNPPADDPLAEDKGGPIALHYRQSSHLRSAIAELGRELIDGRADLCLQPGDFVVERAFGSAVHGALRGGQIGGQRTDQGTRT